MLTHFYPLLESRCQKFGIGLSDTKTLRVFFGWSTIRFFFFGADFAMCRQDAYSFLMPSKKKGLRFLFGQLELNWTSRLPATAFVELFILPENFRKLSKPGNCSGKLIWKKKSKKNKLILKKLLGTAWRRRVQVHSQYVTERQIIPKGKHRSVSENRHRVDRSIGEKENTDRARHQRQSHQKPINRVNMQQNNNQRLSENRVCV